MGLISRLESSLAFPPKKGDLPDLPTHLPVSGELSFILNLLCYFDTTNLADVEGRVLMLLIYDWE